MEQSFDLDIDQWLKKLARSSAFGSEVKIELVLLIGIIFLSLMLSAAEPS